MSTFGPLVTTQWLQDHRGEPDVKILDASWRMPGNDPARADYERRHIDGAIFFDIDAISDPDDPMPHMLPSPDMFEQTIGAMGLSNADRIVVYDDEGLFSAARVWWMFKIMGQETIAVLDGGLPKWMAEGFPVTDSETEVAPAIYKADLRPELVCDSNDVRAGLALDDTLVLDARAEARFTGEVPEPRPGVRSGHMPGAQNLPFAQLLNEDKTFRSRGDLKDLLQAKGVAPGQKIITSCGTGITAAIITLALELIGHDSHTLYDGSWTQWGDETNDAEAFPVVR